MVKKTKSAHLVDVRFKIFYLFICSILVFLVPSITDISEYLRLGVLYLISFFVTIVFYFCSSHVFAKSLSNLFLKIVKSSIPVYVLCAFTFLFNALRVSTEGINWDYFGTVCGLFYALRILYLVWMSLSVVYTTTSHELVCGLKSILGPLRCFSVLVDDCVLTISIALRFIPEMMVEYKSIVEAQWARGALTDSGSAFKRLKSHASAILPLMVRMLSQADDYALALEARGWGCK